MPAGRPLGGRPARGPATIPESPGRGFTVGVIWGEGMADHRSSTTGAGIRHRIERFMRALWDRLSAYARTTEE
jgi:hypothetical protein